MQQAQAGRHLAALLSGPLAWPGRRSCAPPGMRMPFTACESKGQPGISMHLGSAHARPGLLLLAPRSRARHPVCMEHGATRKRTSPAAALDPEASCNLSAATIAHLEAPLNFLPRHVAQDGHGPRPRALHKLDI